MAKKLSKASLDLLVKIKRIHKDAKLPQYMHSGDAGADITCTYFIKERPKNWFDRWFPVYAYHTGLKLEIPDTHFAMLAPRSSIAKVSAWLTNGVGIIEPIYRGEILFKFRGWLGNPPYQKGDRVGQITYHRKYLARHIDIGDQELGTTDRGEGGFGSTGN